MPSIITVGWGTIYETVFYVTSTSGDSPSNYALTGVTWLRGYEGNLAEGLALNCLNHKEYFNQWGTAIATLEEILDGTSSGAVLTTPQINDTSSDHQYIFAVNELTADRTVTLPLLTAGDIFTFNDFTATLTNKRITKRVTTITSHATPTVNTDNCDVVTITAQAEAITSMTTNLSGTPTNFQTLIFRILDNGTGRAITWGASFQAMGTDLPTTTTASKVLTVGFIYDTVDSKFGCVAVSEEA